MIHGAPSPLGGLQQSAAELRQKLSQADSQVAAASAQVAGAQSRLRQATTTGAHDAATINAELRLVRDQLNAAVAARGQIAQSLADLIAHGIAQVDPELLLAQLDRDLPIALLPVRIETRFNVNKPTELLLRVFPDDIHADSFEPELTAEEQIQGREYWTTTWRGGTTEPAATNVERGAWAKLSSALGPARAAWVVQALEPAPMGRPKDPVPDDAPLPAQPHFKSVNDRGSAWTRPPWTTVLPDHWLALAYQGNRLIASAWSRVIPDRLHLGPDPGRRTTAQPDAIKKDEPNLDPELRWFMDFGEAFNQGMALRLEVGALDAIDIVLVVGVRTSLPPDQGANRLAGLLDAHHYTRGLSFVPQGTPTNNTLTDRSDWTSQPSAEASFRTERRSSVPGPAANATVAAQAMGVPAEALSAIAHGADVEQELARQMNTALWPATWGYYLGKLVNPQVAEASQVVRQHYIDFVRGRGPIPALRVGNQPYGVLPVTALDPWRALDEEPAIAHLVAFLRQLRPFWQSGIGSVPRVAPGTDVDAGLVGALGMRATSVNVWVRSVEAATFSRVVTMFGPGSDFAYFENQMALAMMVYASLNLGFVPYILDSFSLHAEHALLGLPRVVPADGSSPAVYLEHLRTAGAAELQAEAASGRAASLLEVLLRHSLMLTFADTAAAASPSGRVVAHQLEGELLVPNGAARAAAGAIARHSVAKTQDLPLQLLYQPVAGLTGGKPLAQWLSSAAAARHPLALDIQTLQAAVAFLKDRPAAELELALAEGLDTCAYRLDAWITSIATRRLRSLRTRRPTGVYLGGYGWVENVRRRPARQLVEPPAAGLPSPLAIEPDNAGFIHAPSMAQAATAAVLRSGHLSHAGRAADGALAVDLSSARTRLALTLLDGVRQGQPLSALLGYRLERNLHDAAAQLHLDRCIDGLRSLAPLVANQDPATRDPQGPVEAIAARNVVDGLALQRMDRATALARLRNLLLNPPPSPFPRPAPTPAEADALINGVAHELTGLDNMVDALSDLLTAESVYHLVQGNPQRAGITVDMIGRGGVHPPDPDVVQTPRTGAAVANRLLVLLSAGPTALADDGAWPQQLSPRAAAEPRLEAWARRLLGDPTRVRIRANFVADAGTVTPTVTLESIGLCALDVVYSCAAGKGQGELLQQRITSRLALNPPAGAPPSATIALLPGRDAAWPTTDLGLGELVEIARTLHTVIAQSRAINGLDLVQPETKGATSGIDGADLQARASAALTAFAQATTRLGDLLTPTMSTDGTAVLRALDALADFGVDVGEDGSGLRDVPVLSARAAAVYASAAARQKKVAATQATGRPASDPLGRYDLELLEDVYGDGFRILPRFTAANGSLIQASLDASDRLQGGDPSEANRWLLRVSEVRPGAGRIARLLTEADALVTGRGFGLRVAQIPFDPSDQAARWIGLEMATPPAGPVLGLVAFRPDGLDARGALAGMLVDDWVEVIPAASTITAISFNTSASLSRPPQSILLAVAPDPATAWSSGLLAAILRETLDLAKLRLVDLEAVNWAGRALPAIYIADNALGAVPSVPLKSIVNASAKFDLKAVQP